MDISLCHFPHSFRIRLALLAKAVYNLVDTAYIGLLKNDLAMSGVGVTAPLLLIMVFIENIFAAGASILAGRQLGAKDEERFHQSVRFAIKGALYPAFGLCYMMTITYQTIGASRYGLFLSLIRQGLFYVPFICILPKFLGVLGIYLSQPFADILTILVCVCSIKSMRRIASVNMQKPLKYLAEQ